MALITPCDRRPAISAKTDSTAWSTSRSGPANASNAISLCLHTACRVPTTSCFCDAPLWQCGWRSIASSTASAKVSAGKMPGHNKQTRKKINGPRNAITRHMRQMPGWSLKYGYSITARIILGIMSLSLAVAQPETTTKPAEPGEYRIGAGDVLQILVWREPDASLPETMVQSDGKISVPLIGEVEAAGLTVMELQNSLTQKIEHYIHNPVVSVHAKQINSRKVYVMGAVKKEGPIPLLRRSEERRVGKKCGTRV